MNAWFALRMFAATILAVIGCVGYVGWSNKRRHGDDSGLVIMLVSWGLSVLLYWVAIRGQRADAQKQEEAERARQAEEREALKAEILREMQAEAENRQPV